MPATATLSLDYLRRIFWGAPNNQSNTDAEYAALLAAKLAGIDFLDLIGLAQNPISVITYPVAAGGFLEYIGIPVGTFVPLNQIVTFFDSAIKYFDGVASAAYGIIGGVTATGEIQAGFLASAIESVNTTIWVRVQRGGLSLNTVSAKGVRLSVTNSIGNICVAAYNNSSFGEDDEKPLTRKATSGNVPCPAVGKAEVLFGTPYQFNTNNDGYGAWLSIGADNILAAFLHGLEPVNSDLIVGMAWKRAVYPAPANPSPLTLTPVRYPQMQVVF